MPEQPMDLDQQTSAVLDAVCEKKGLANHDQAIEWLLRRRLRKGNQGLTGRGRALYPIERKN
ncbi:hypothetical protein [Halomonas citrativorans]|uniref:Transcriptional regulator n=1 Tax=Halomonas citrativorans TaxID=2742612 RepID=A0ABR9FEV5_9GAMM|nr:hypothetical protein [Halomonas citrativorans]MBE0405014.1 hypothetical protein [Halomonas citrativorans]